MKNTGEQAYNLRLSAKSWPEIGVELGINANSALVAAARYAGENNLKWPLKRKIIWVRQAKMI